MLFALVTIILRKFLTKNGYFVDICLVKTLDRPPSQHSTNSVACDDLNECAFLMHKNAKWLHLWFDVEQPTKFEALYNEHNSDLFSGETYRCLMLYWNPLIIWTKIRFFERFLKINAMLPLENINWDKGSD